MHRRTICSPLIAMLCVLPVNAVRQTNAAERLQPPLNTVAIAHVGDTILQQGESYQRAAIHLKDEISFGDDGAWALTPGYYFRTGESIGWETYAPADGPDAGSVRKAPGAITLQGSFHFSNDGETIGVITNFYQAVNTKARYVTRTTRPAWSSDSLQRLLVYGGKSGTSIKLGYREIWKNITMPSRDVFIEFDLADSRVVEFKGARIEVIEADNNVIRYRVTRAFAGD